MAEMMVLEVERGWRVVGGWKKEDPPGFVNYKHC